MNKIKYLVYCFLVKEVPLICFCINNRIRILNGVPNTNKLPIPIIPAYFTDY